MNSRGDAQEKQLQEVLSVMNAVANGQFQIALSGPLTAQLVAPGLALQQPAISATLPPATPQTDVLADASATPKPPEYTLFDARTVAEVWAEWKEGIAGPCQDLGPPPEAEVEGPDRLES